MKKLILFAGLLLLILSDTYSQHLDVQAKSYQNETTLFERVTKLEKKTDMFHMYLNMQGSFNVHLLDGDVEQAAFRMNQLRWEMKGNVTDWIYYRYRQRLNRGNSSQSLDNMPSSIDYAAVGVHATDKFSIFVGKQCTAFGGIEFDMNPIDVYEYSDILEYMNNFLTGIDFSYFVTPQQEFRFQIVNSRNGSFEDLYGAVPADIEMTKIPLGYTFNWNGSFCDDILKTRWSASVFHEAKKKNWYYYALGTQLSLPAFSGFFDFMYSDEDIDRTGLLSSETSSVVKILDTRYMAMVLQLNIPIIPSLNLFAKGMYETASIRKENQGLEKGKYRTAWGYMGGIEFYPTKENLHFFLNYIGRSYDYTDRGKILGMQDNSPQRLELGFIYQLPVF